MKLLFVDTTNDAPNVGGGHLFLPELLIALSSRGFDIHLVTKGKPHHLVEERLDNSQITRHERPWRSGGLVDDTTPQFAEWLESLAPDVYFVSGSFDIGWTVLPSLGSCIATMMVGHNDEETFYAPVRHYNRFLTRAVGVSDEICRKYSSECGMPVERVSWIPYGVEVSDAEPTDPGNGPIRLIYVGRLDETQKRISDVVKIVRRLGDAGVDFQLQIVGDGNRRGFVETELAGQIASGRVRMRGWLSSPEVIDAMRESEVFILASAYEGFCISLTEAMANGCTPIVTDIDSGNKQLVRNGENGFVVPIGDITAFVDKLTILAKDRELVRRLRLAAWETGRQYSIDRMVENYVSCFEEAIEDARLKPRTPNPEFPLMPSCRSKYPLWLRRIKARIVGSR